MRRPCHPPARSPCQSQYDAIMDDMEMPLVPVLCAMEEAGLAVDIPYLSTLGERMGGQMDALAESIYTLAGERFNIGSTKKLQEILFEKLQLPSGKKTKTGYSTGADVLEALAPRARDRAARSSTGAKSPN